MVEKSLADTVLTMIRSEANNNPAPVGCTIKQAYTGYVDVTLTDGSVIRSVRCLGDATKGSDAVLVFLDGTYSNMLVVPPSSNGGGDMSDYVKKSDVSFTVSLLDNGCMSFKLTY